MDANARDVLDFWFGELTVEDHFRMDDALDGTIRERFHGLWEGARADGFGSWTCEARSCLALVILLDQFPRNMFRGDARSFATDARALAVAKKAIARGQDLRIPGPERHFFYMPLEHSEMIADQHRSVRMFYLNIENPDFLLHARAHRWVIRSFGRFPYRNAALGRVTTAEERAFLDAGGYRTAVEAVGA